MPLDPWVVDSIPGRGKIFSKDKFHIIQNGWLSPFLYTYPSLFNLQDKRTIKVKVPLFHLHQTSFFKKNLKFPQTYPLESPSVVTHPGATHTQHYLLNKIWCTQSIHHVLGYINRYEWINKWPIHYFIYLWDNYTLTKLILQKRSSK